MTAVTSTSCCRGPSWAILSRYASGPGGHRIAVRSPAGSPVDRVCSRSRAGASRPKRDHRPTRRSGVALALSDNVVSWL
jgi:hypothetical protein